MRCAACGGWLKLPGTGENKFFAGMNVISNFASNFLNRFIPLLFKKRNGLIIDSDFNDQRFN
jgi:hypothetical protein